MKQGMKKLAVREADQLLVTLLKQLIGAGL